MRKILNAIYLSSGVLAGLFLAAIAIVIMAQVVIRQIGFAFDATELSGFFMAASTFLGLAYTFRDGGHVRVTLLVDRAHGKLKGILECWCCLASAGLMAYVSWYAIDMTWDSYQFNDISTGLMAIAFWIPQLGMTLGLIVLTLALLDAFFTLMAGKVPGYQKNVDNVLV